MSVSVECEEGDWVRVASGLGSLVGLGVGTGKCLSSWGRLPLVSAHQVPCCLLPPYLSHMCPLPCLFLRPQATALLQT